MSEVEIPKGRRKMTPEEKALAKQRRIDYLKGYYLAHKDKWDSRYCGSDYSKATIYRVFSPETDRFYIGSTSRPLEHRLAEHRRCIMRRSNRLYAKMADLSLLWQIEPLMSCEAECREYLEQLELLYIAAASVDGKVLNTNKRYDPAVIKALKHLMGILKDMKPEHLPDIFKL